ncbi:MAG TPA: D-alanine--D-alanine ligase [Alphaproteobacteria bacterium]|nr:D-alanine--D-alanine ligase [Alphaproteobacteria bacterium]
MSQARQFEHVAVLMGGRSAEREVSLASGRACAQALREHYRVTGIDFTGDVSALVRSLTGQDAPQVVFNALHGRYGEDGTIQGLLDLLGLPYTHSGICASAHAMDKSASRSLFTRIGLRVPAGLVLPLDEAATAFPPPYVIKPVAEGSSVGVCVVQPGDNQSSLSDWAFGDSVLVEQYIPGRELTCAVLDDADGRPGALAPLEIRPRDPFYTYDSKYAVGGSDHLIPAPVPKSISLAIRAAALAAHRALGCRGVSRSDFRYDDSSSPGTPDGQLFILETNTQPGMTATSLVPEIAAHAGIGFSDLVAGLVEGARCGD